MARGVGDGAGSVGFNQLNESTSDGPGAPSVASTGAPRRRSSITNRMLERMFPGAQKALSAYADSSVRTGMIRKRQLASSSSLQIALYYNTLYSILYAVLHIFVFRYKVLNNTIWYRTFLPVILFSVWAIVEIARLLLGYIGNLQEKVQHLAAFFVLTMLPQTGLVIYFAHAQSGLMPIDEVSGTILLAFLLFEIFSGYRAVKNIIRIQTTRYRLDYGCKDAIGAFGVSPPPNLDLYSPAVPGRRSSQYSAFKKNL